ncbi:MAG: hypothetical protein U0X20_03410 [Caldilineaceae bacterium]
MNEPETTQAAGTRQPWDQLEGEPNAWYGRFQVYLELGVTRTLKVAATEAGLQVSGGGTWSTASRRWRWRERAHAWDVHQRELLALSERNTRLALHSRRVERMEDYLDAVCEVLDTANMTAADEQLAREWLPQMRVFLRDLLVAERQEFERGDYERNDPDSGLVITADDLRAAQRAANAVHSLEAQAGLPRTCADKSVDFTHPAAVPGDDRYPVGRTLLVCIGPDSALMLDLAALRAVRSATDLKFRRLLDATRPKFAETLRRERSLGRPVELLHLALHASPAGVEFADGIAEGSWLSERLFGVRIMLLASCQGDSIGDWLGVVPHVITLSEDISHEDAAVLTQHFWHNIGLNMEPGAALDEALTHCPPAVSEYVVRHW